MNIPDFYIEPAHYPIDFPDLQTVRQSVFVIEQQIPAEIEFDALDRHCHHFIARDAQRRPIGTARMTQDGKLGRMAVVQDSRGRGVGGSLLQALIEKARHLELTTISANAQLTALGFYEKFGFIPEGDTFLSAGLPHQAIRLNLIPVKKIVRPNRKPRENSIQAVRIDSVELMTIATQEIISAARREILIYSPALEYKLYAQQPIVETLKQFVLDNRNSTIRIIIHDTAKLQTKIHPVLELAQRLPSYFQLRTPLEFEDLQYASGFILNDCDAYLVRLQDNRHEGHWSPNLPAKNRQLHEEFEHVWQRSRICTEFRALGL